MEDVQALRAFYALLPLATSTSLTTSLPQPEDPRHRTSPLLARHEATPLALLNALATVLTSRPEQVVALSAAYDVDAVSLYVASSGASVPRDHFRSLWTLMRGLALTHVRGSLPAHLAGGALQHVGDAMDSSELGKRMMRAVYAHCRTAIRARIQRRWRSFKAFAEEFPDPTVNSILNRLTLLTSDRVGSLDDFLALPDLLYPRNDPILRLLNANSPSGRSFARANRDFRQRALDRLQDVDAYLLSEPHRHAHEARRLQRLSQFDAASYLEDVWSVQHAVRYLIWWSSQPEVNVALLKPVHVHTVLPSDVGTRYRLLKRPQLSRHDVEQFLLAAYETIWSDMSWIGCESVRQIPAFVSKQRDSILRAQPAMHAPLPRPVSLLIDYHGNYEHRHHRQTRVAPFDCVGASKPVRLEWSVDAPRLSSAKSWRASRRSDGRPSFVWGADVSDGRDMESEIQELAGQILRRDLDPCPVFRLGRL